jgi:ribosomal-protein-alanine N-acetyltransferase
MIPPLSTAKLTLRPYNTDDVEALHELWTSAAVREHLWDGNIISVEQARAVVREAIADAARTNIGMWTLWLKGDRRLAGFCGFRWVGIAPEPELLYALREDLWGQGLAGEAARKCIEWLFQTKAVSRVLAGADPANERSQRVLERLGFVAIEEPLIGCEHIRYFALERPGTIGGR